MQTLHFRQREPVTAVQQPTAIFCSLAERRAAGALIVLKSARAGKPHLHCRHQ